MQDLVNQNEFALISNYVYDISGIVIPPEKYYLIETRLFKLMLDSGVESFDEFYKKVLLPDNTDVAQKVINAITVNETFWFRDATLWKCFERVLLPEYVKRLISGERAKIRIWSAAASTGQEAYSIAMCIDNYLQRNKITSIDLSYFEILATDISSRVIDLAKNGRYDKISMTRGISDHYKAAYFQQNGQAWFLDPLIKDAVTFRNFNLLDDYKQFGLFDLIFCRYVLIYFPDALKAKIVRKMCNSLSGGGVLFTGSYVLYDMLSSVFEVEAYENLTYYSKPHYVNP